MSECKCSKCGRPRQVFVCDECFLTPDYLADKKK
jgi:hypothetical protein